MYPWNRFKNKGNVLKKKEEKKKNLRYLHRENVYKLFMIYLMLDMVAAEYIDKSSTYLWCDQARLPRSEE